VDKADAFELTLETDELLQLIAAMGIENKCNLPNCLLFITR
jgi:hypothetical protein